MDPLERALRFGWSIADAAADEALRIEQGTVLRAPSLPDAWSVNAVRLEGIEPDLSLEDLDVLAGAHVRVPYRHVLVEDERTALRLDELARAASGWTAERHVVMTLATVPGETRGPPPRVGTLDEVLALMRAWLTEEGHPAPTIDQLVRRIAREHAIVPEVLVVADHDGAPAAMCTVRLGDGVAQLEDVFVLERARGAGLGRAVTVAGARAAAAHADVVFIVADDLDWPKELYAAVGFEELARRAELHGERRPRGPGSLPGVRPEGETGERRPRGPGSLPGVRPEGETRAAS